MQLQRNTTWLFPAVFPHLRIRWRIITTFRARRIQVLMDVGQELLLVAASILMQWDRLKYCRAYCWEITAEICHMFWCCCMESAR